LFFQIGKESRERMEGLMKGINEEIGSVTKTIIQVSFGKYSMSFNKKCRSLWTVDDLIKEIVKMKGGVK